MPTSQCNSAKMITILKELFAEHGIPEEIRSDNRPQFASHPFAEFTKDWNIKHSTSSPRNNNDRTLWLPATVVCAANHGSYIIKVIGGAEYR